MRSGDFVMGQKTLHLSGGTAAQVQDTGKASGGATLRASSLRTWTR